MTNEEKAVRTAEALEQIARGLKGNNEIAEALRDRAFRLRHLNYLFPQREQPQ